MKKNVGTTDQVIRFLLGIGLMSLYIYAEGAAVRWTGLGVGAVLVLTSIFSFCPLYAMFRLNTRGVKSSAPHRKTEGEKVTTFQSRKTPEKQKKEERKEDHKDAA